MPSEMNSDSITWGYPLKYTDCANFPLTVSEEIEPILDKLHPKCIDSSQVEFKGSMS